MPRFAIKLKLEENHLCILSDASMGNGGCFKKVSQKQLSPKQ